jgi:Na+/proline symporter
MNATPAAGTSWVRFLLTKPFNIWMGVIGGTVMVMSSHGAEQLIVQRVLACNTVADGRKALALSAVVIFPLFLIFLLVGAMLWVFYQGHPFQIPLPEPKPGSAANDFIFPIFMMTEVPHLLKGFLIVAILSAAMSSVSSALTSLASVSTMDFVKHVMPNRSEGFFLRFSKISTVVWAAALIGLAYLSRQVEFVLNAAFALRGLTSGALLGGLALAVFWRKGRAMPVVTAMLVSLVVMTSLQFLPKFECVKDLWKRTFNTEIIEVFWPWYTLIGLTVTLVTAWAVRRMTAKADGGVNRET